MKKRNARRNDHRLDRYIRSLLEIERRQIQLDSNWDSDDLDKLQALLDAVTLLRQRALHEVSAHDLNEDRGIACFMNMCHELSQKINAKLSRQRLDAKLSELTDAVRTAGGETSAESVSERSRAERIE